MTLTDEQFYSDANYYAGATVTNSPLEIPEKLLLTLEAAIDARSRIRPLQEEMRELVDGAENDIERDARLYQIDLIDLQLTRAADLAEERLGYLRRIKNKS